MPLISIITRTCDRIPLLNRCYKAINQSTCKDFEWIIVDDKDGGTLGLADFVRLVRSASQMDIRMVYAGKEHRAKAANIGLKECRGQFVHFLDDDDLIFEDFYKTMTTFLSRHPRYDAVVCLSMAVVERVCGGSTFEIVSRTPHFPDLRSISLPTFAVAQSFPPVAFVARRDSLQNIGPFDELLPVCEDYDIFLRFLLKYDIGVIPEYFCEFRQRLLSADLPHAWRNSDVTYNYSSEDALFRNLKLRDDLNRGQFGIGFLLAMAELNKSSWRLDRLVNTVSSRSWAKFLMAKLKKGSN